MGDASKTLKSAKKHGVKGGTISLGRGTINNRFLEFLGLNEVRKEIVAMIVEDELVAKTMKGIGEDMDFNKPHQGIAFSCPVGEFIGFINTADKNSESNEVKNDMYKVIYVVVDKGKAEDVMNAANQAGARGGTIMNGRGAGIHEVQKFFSIEIEPEKEVVFIIVKTAIKDAIIASIRSHLHIDEPGKGIIFVVDINEVYGLRED
jgi:nitrogen regulatory protein PII